MRKDNARRPGEDSAASRPSRKNQSAAPRSAQPRSATPRSGESQPRPQTNSPQRARPADVKPKGNVKPSGANRASASSSSRSSSPRKPKTTTSQTQSRTTLLSTKSRAAASPPAPAAGSENLEVATENSARLQKLIAQAGLASRRAAEELIRDGRVSVNGKVVRELGAKADPQSDRIVVDGKPLQPPGAPVVLVLHKPKGYVTTKSDPEGRPTVMDLLPKKYQHLHPVGRLDFDTAGVLLLTNDGELTNLLTHPSHGVTKTYWARVKGKPEKETLQKLARGIRLEDGPTAPCQARLKAQTENNSLIEIVLHEGRNRQVRRMLEAVGHPVRALRRVGFANLDVKDLLSGEYRELLPTEVRQLRKLAETPEKAKPKKPRGHKPKTQPRQNVKPKDVRTRDVKPKPVSMGERIRRVWEE